MVGKPCATIDPVLSKLKNANAAMARAAEIAPAGGVRYERHARRRQAPGPFRANSRDATPLPQPLTSAPTGPLSGAFAVPGDKSISHRAVMLAASAVGETTIVGLLEAADVLATVTAMRALGADIERHDGVWRIHGRGVGGLVEPATVLDFGNSGTGARLVAGLCASHPFTSFLSGDASLSRRPMRRIMVPLTEIGAAFLSRSGDRLPLAIRGAAAPRPIRYALPVASAQVKSAILLAGLNTPGETTVIEPQPTRDHTERMLRHFGAEVRTALEDTGARRITLAGQPELVAGGEIRVPGDFSSAAFPLVAAHIIPGSRLTVRGVGVNEHRTGLMTTLRDMGADLESIDERDAGGEPVADLRASAGALAGVHVPAERVPSMIDEFPILAIAAACATGVTRFSGLAELRVKESDRLTAIADGLTANGIAVEAGDDWLAISGCGGPPPGGGLVTTAFDHRIAMAFLVLGAAARAPVTIDCGAAIVTSFPGFIDLMNGAGTRIAAA